jgi:hypothetical protein
MLQRLTLVTEYFLAQQNWTAISALRVGGNLSDIAKMDVTVMADWWVPCFFKGCTDVLLSEETVLPLVSLHRAIRNACRQFCIVTEKSHAVWRVITISDSRICLRSHPFLGMVGLPLRTLPTLGSGSFAAMMP